MPDGSPAYLYLPCVPLGRSRSPVWTLQQHAVGLAKAKLFIQAVRISSVEQPAEVGPRPLLDHDVHQPTAQLLPTVLRENEHVREVCKPRAVAHSASKADHAAVILLVTADNPPRTSDLGLDVLASAPPSPVRVLRQEAPNDVEVHTTTVVVEEVGHGTDGSPG